MVEVLLKPEGFEWWLDDALEFVKAVYGELLEQEKLYIVSFVASQIPEARKILRERAPWLPEEELGDVMSMEAAAYIYPYGVLVVPVPSLKKTVLCELTVSFFHEATHHVLHTTGTLRRLTTIYARILPLLGWALEETESITLAMRVYHYVDELFAHYAQLCYATKLSREPCIPGRFFNKAASLVERRTELLETYRKVVGRDIAPKDLENTEITFTGIMHITFMRMIKKHPADFYNEYISKPRERSIFEGREELLKWYGDP